MWILRSFKQLRKERKKTVILGRGHKSSPSHMSARKGEFPTGRLGERKRTQVTIPGEGRRRGALRVNRECSRWRVSGKRARLCREEGVKKD